MLHLTDEMPAEQRAGAGRRALITGLTGQDGSYLAELLLQKGYEVTGLIRGGSARSLGCAEHLRGRVTLIEGELTDSNALEGVVLSLRPDELYHLAAPSFVPDSWRHPAKTIEAIACSCATLLQAVRDYSLHTRVFIASSAAIFGSASESPQTELTACQPVSPYATAKLAAHQLTGQMRTEAGIFACSGILYNHESERRPEMFVTRKITKAAAAVKLGLEQTVNLGSLEAIRDWSFAADIMRGAWLMLQQPDPEDFILASGIGHTVFEFAKAAFAHLGLDAKQCVRRDPALERRSEHAALVGDPSKARRLLGWHPTISFEQLVERMVDADLAALRRGEIGRSPR